MKPGLATSRRFERNAMSAAKRGVTPRRGVLQALTSHALAWLAFAPPLNSPSGLRSRWMWQRNQTHRSRRRCPRHVPAGPAGERATIDSLRLRQIPPRQSRRQCLSKTPAAAAKFAAGIPRADARVRIGMAKDEGNGGSGGQNLVRFRPDLSGEMSLQWLPAITGRGAVAQHPVPFGSGAVLSPLHAANQSFSAGAARIWPPLRRNHSLPSGRMNPLVTARGDNRRHEKILSRKQGAREPRPAVSIPLVKSSSGLRRARRRRRGGLRAAGLRTTFLALTFLAGAFLTIFFAAVFLTDPFLAAAFFIGLFLAIALRAVFLTAPFFTVDFFATTLLRRGFPCWLFGGCLHHVQSSSAVFSRLIRNAD